MSTGNNQPGKGQNQYLLNMTLGAVVSQVGCLTALVIIGALLAGLWLDNLLGTKPQLTIVLLLASAPLTLIGMVWIVRKTTARIKPVDPSELFKEDASSGKNS
jgi:F0F1-type ATP synthase assembly protein I